MATYNITQSPNRAEDRSLGELFGDLTRESTQLVRQEINLAKTELTEKASKAGKDVGMIAAGGIVAYTGVLALVAFLILGLIALGMAAWVSSLLVGIVLACVGAGMAMAGLKKLRQVDPVPHQSMEALKSDVRG